MSLAESVSTPSSAARRFHTRRKIDGLSYVEFGPDNGAILIDLSEGGLGFQSVLPVSSSEMLLFKFKLPGQSDYVEGFAEVAWMNDSGKGGGLRFTELSDDARAQIREWAAPLSAPEVGALDARNGAESHAAPEKTNQAPAAHSKTAPSNIAANTIDQPEPPAKVSDEFATGESAQPPSPSFEPPMEPCIEKDAQAAEPVQEAAPAEEITDEIEIQEAPAPIDAPTQAPLRPAIPEFTIEVAPPDPPSERADSLPPAPAFVPNPVSDAARSAKQPAKEAPAKARGPRRVPSATNLPAAGASSAVDAAITTPVHARHVPAPAIPSLKPDTNAKPLVASPIPERSRHTEPTHAPRVSENALEKDSNQSLLNSAIASQALRFGAAVAAGAAFVLLFFLAVPSLRTRVQATAARSAALNPAGTPAFEVEVADINNRRWVLTGGGQAGSPFSETPSRREAQSSNSANTGRNETAKPSRSDEAADDSTATTNSKQSKLPTPAELALRRPRAAQATAASAQVVPPSIFDGITPPVGSLSDRLSAAGPEAPGIVPPETRQPRATSLQSAVLLQRVSPVYPPNAMQARVQGDVLVNATIDKNGIPKNLKAINGDLRLVPAALDAIRQWRYRPATLSGQPIETDIEVTISFQLK